MSENPEVRLHDGALDTRERVCLMRDIRPSGPVLIEVTYVERMGIPSGIYDQQGPGFYPDGPWDRQTRVLPDGDWVTIGGRKADGSHWWQAAS